MEGIDKSMKVLVIDDSLLMRTAMSAIFKHIGFQNVEAADGGKSALEMIEKEQYQLIMLDWIMPEMTGLEFLKAAKELENYKDVPIIVASAENVEENVTEAKDAGAAGYLAKPYKPDGLKAKLETVFGTGEAS